MSAAGLPLAIRVGLRLLPPGYRDHRSDEISSTLAQSAVDRPLAVGAEALSLLGLAVRVRSRSLLAPPSAARGRAASIASVVLPILLVVPALTAIAFHPWHYEVTFAALVPGWIVVLLAAFCTLAGSAPWSHRLAVASTGLFIGGLLLLIATSNLRTAVHELGWLPLLATSAALTRDPRRMILGRRAMGRWGLAALSILTLVGAIVYGSSSYFAYQFVNHLGVFFVSPRIIATALVLAICLACLAFRPMRAVIPGISALVMTYVGAGLESSQWNNGQPDGQGDAWPGWHLVMQLVIIPVLVFVAVRALTALIDRLNNRFRAGRGRGIPV